jgi:dienelactone hydrolase
MTLREETLQLQTDEGLPLRLRVCAPAETQPLAAIVVCHGFKGFAQWGFFPHVCQRLAERGFAAIRFDFSHNGIGEQATEFTRMDLFASNSYSRECADLPQVLTWWRQAQPEPLGALPMGLLGHSRASVPVLTVAAEQGIAAVVTWNGVSRALRFSERQLREWELDGRMEFTNARTGQRMAMDYGFVVDAREHRERFDPIRQAQRSGAAHLILHGDADMAVDPSEAEELRGEREAPRCQLLRIRSGHTFGAVHPFAGTTPALETALEHTANWFMRWLGDA